MNHFPYPWGTEHTRTRRRLTPAVLLATLGVGLWVGGFILIAMGWLTGR